MSCGAKAKLQHVIEKRFVTFVHTMCLISVRAGTASPGQHPPNLRGCSRRAASILNCISSKDLDKAATQGPYAQPLGRCFNESDRYKLHIDLQALRSAAHLQTREIPRFAYFSDLLHILAFVLPVQRMCLSPVPPLYHCNCNVRCMRYTPRAAIATRTRA
jgi:hypothetical protein